MSAGGRILVRAPGRVNLIGEHTDYNDGFVLPVAIELAVTLRAEVRGDETVRLTSGAFGEPAEIRAGEDPSALEPRWARNAAGVIHVLREAGLAPVGFSAVVDSDLPVGGGLSSSAAFEVAVALAAVEAARAAGAPPPPGVAGRARLAALCRDAEERATGARVGIMDPFIALHARPGTALLLDCRTLSHGAVELNPARLALVVADTGVRRAAAEDGCDRRRAECEEAVEAFREAGRGIRALRDIPPAGLAEALEGLPETAARRARHVVTENARTLSAASALAAGDLERFGALLDESHESLKADYEVSCPELDALVAIARAVPGVYGSRMTGGGFGGCTLTAARPGSVPALLAAIAGEYPARTGREASARPVSPSGGASVRRG